MRGPNRIGGIPFAPTTRAEMADAAGVSHPSRRPLPFYHRLIAKPHHAMLTRDDPDPNKINGRAAFVLAD